MAQILIYGPDKTLSQKLCDSLKKEKYDALLCDEHTLPLSALQQESAPLVILDAQLRWTLCRPLLDCFAHHGCPILFLTADRQMRDHLRALYSGRCEVHVASSSHKTLRSKIRALLGEAPAARELKVNGAERVAHLDGRRVELTAQEFALLTALMEQPDVPVSREQLLREAWGYQSMGETRTVDVHIQRLRRKLGDDCIETVYKCGYRLQGLIPCMI